MSEWKVRAPDIRGYTSKKEFGGKGFDDAHQLKMGEDEAVKTWGG
jgi:hypothetical protein